MDLAQISSITDVQQLREIVIEQLAAINERDLRLVERDATLAERDATLAKRDAVLAERDAQVAQRQLIETLENLIASSLKTCRTSMVIGVRTSQPVHSHRDLAEQERVLSDRRQKVLYTVMQMNGSRGLPEDLAKRRLFIGGLPGMSEENQRENDCLTVHAADLLPMETAWHGTPQSPLIHQVGAVLGLILVAMIVYFGTAFAIGGASLGMLRRNLKRKPGTPPAATPAGED